MIFDPKYVRAADGRKLSDGKGDTTSLGIATDDVFRTCCREACLALERGTDAMVEEGQTLEQAVAKYAVWKGIARRGLGRTPDEAEWAAQLVRWEHIVFEETARIEGRREHLLITRKDERQLTIPEAHDEGLRPEDVWPDRSEWRSTGEVFTRQGWRPLSEVPRSER